MVTKEIKRKQASQDLKLSPFRRRLAEQYLGSLILEGKGREILDKTPLGFGYASYQSAIMGPDVRDPEKRQKRLDTQLRRSIHPLTHLLIEKLDTMPWGKETLIGLAAEGLERLEEKSGEKIDKLAASDKRKTDIKLLKSVSAGKQ